VDWVWNDVDRVYVTAGRNSVTLCGLDSCGWQ